jgi:hypothetical protein
MAAEKALVDKTARDKAAADKAAAAAAPATADKSVNLAALSAGPPPVDLTKSVQSELRRVGCLTGNADGEWNAASQRSLTLFNRYAGTKLDAKVASLDTLDVIKQKSSRVCPLVCEHGFKADGDHCSKITCAEGSFLNDDNQCERRRDKKPAAKRPGSRAAASEPAAAAGLLGRWRRHRLRPWRLPAGRAWMPPRVQDYRAGRPL